MGSERHAMVMNDEDKRRTAYHEAGHAIIGLVLADKEHDPVYKVSIIPRGRALGVTMFLPEEDKYSMTVTALESQICSLYGGRIAEDMIFGWGKVTTGASNDIERASEIARNIVIRWGLNNKLGPILYAEDEQEVFLGKSMGKTRAFSEETAKKIDNEVSKIISDNYKRSEAILKDNLDKLHAMSDALIKFETIDASQIEDIMAGRDPRPPEEVAPVKPVKRKRVAKKTTSKTRDKETGANSAENDQDD